jgi:hypothetical protein
VFDEAALSVFDAEELKKAMTKSAENKWQECKVWNEGAWGQCHPFQDLFQTLVCATGRKADRDHVAIFSVTPFNSVVCSQHTLTRKQGGAPSFAIGLRSFGPTLDTFSPIPKTQCTASNSGIPLPLRLFFDSMEISETTALLVHAKKQTPLPKFQLFILLWVQLADPLSSQVIFPFINKVLGF